MLGEWSVADQARVPTPALGSGVGWISSSGDTIRLCSDTHVRWEEQGFPEEPETVYTEMFGSALAEASGCL